MVEISRSIDGRLTPAQVYDRIEQITNDRDALSNSTQRLLLLDDLHELKDKITHVLKGPGKRAK
jgi:hypothetical protein